MASGSISLPVMGGGSGAAVSTLEGKYVRTTRFTSIASGTTATITKPASSTIVLNDFGGTIDAVVSQEASGKPTFQPATTAGGEIVTCTFDSAGTYVLSGTPSAYPVSLIYRVRQELTDFDSDASDIIGNSTIEDGKINIQKFTSSGTWTKPTNARIVKVYAIGGGGQGGSGIRGVAGGTRCGGGGGGAGGFVVAEFGADLLGATETVTVGAGGTGGGQEVTVNSTNGNAGANGGSSSFGNWIFAPGGNGGSGGTGAAGAGGVTVLGVASPWNPVAGAGGSANSSGGVGGNGGNSNTFAPTSGGAGGGLSSANAAANGGPGGSILGTIHNMLTLGGLGGSTSAYAGQVGNSVTTLFTSVSIGTGGGGGRADTTASLGYAGGAGGGYGAGGGGGSASQNGWANNNAHGGDGYQGLVVVVTYF
jgi:hypothetical protein